MPGAAGEGLAGATAGGIRRAGAGRAVAGRAPRPAGPARAPAATRKQNGTGLGLAIVENLIKEHNGNIYCTSEKNSQYPEGKVEFWFTLPVAKGYLKLNKKSLGESYVESGK